MIELGAPVLGEPEKAALCAVIDDQWLTMGDRVRRFEEAFARLHEVEEAVAVNSGTAALQLCLAACDVGAGDEVLVPSMSFVATAATVVHVGATPVFVDIEGVDRPHMSLADARRRITPRTRAIMVMHFGGYAVDLAPWRELADAHGLLLFEDAAHCAGLTGRAGVLSDAAAFSFFTNKNMTTAEGGMVTFSDPARRDRARLLRSHGMTRSTLDRARGRASSYDVVLCGHNYRMDELRGALGLVQIERLPAWNTARRALLASYRDLLRAVPDVEMVFDAEHPTSAHILPVLLPADRDRAEVMAAMLADGVQTSVHYPAIHEFDYYRRTHPPVSLPETEGFSRRELTLPLHPALSDDDVDRVVAALGSALKGS